MQDFGQLVQAWQTFYATIAAAILALAMGGSYLHSQGFQLSGLPNGSQTNPTISGQTVTKGIYFDSKSVGIAGHLKGSMSDSNPTPVLSSCGDTPSLLAGSSDIAGKATNGGTATTCTITFGVAWAAEPVCIVQNMTTGARAVAYSVSTTAITATALTAADVIAWHCIGASGS